jgi:hypothetical protein
MATTGSDIHTQVRLLLARRHELTAHYRATTRRPLTGGRAGRCATGTTTAGAEKFGLGVESTH